MGQRRRHSAQFKAKVALEAIRAERTAGETVTHDCPHCGCLFRLSLLRRREDYQNLAHQLFCPFCPTLFDHSMGA